MQQEIRPAAAVSGAIALPGDKSISHRYAMIAALAEGPTRIRNYSTGADCHSTLGCLRALGIEIEERGTEVHDCGQGPRRAARSRRTVWMPATPVPPSACSRGILAAQPFATRIGGDESLSRRPMRRIMHASRGDGRAHRARARGSFRRSKFTAARCGPSTYTLPVPSAQVKTCVLFAGLFAEGTTTVTEPVRSRDHTEIALREFGADVRVGAPKITLTGRPRLTGRELVVPADLSSAAFFIVAALLVPGSRLSIRGVGLNPTRSALLDFLVGMGARIRVPNLESRNGELVGDIVVEHSELRGGAIAGGLTAALIDEIPVLAVLGAATEEGLTVNDAAELRVKETDRIRTVVDNLRRMGVEAEELPDGLVVPGRQKFHAARIRFLRRPPHRHGLRRGRACAPMACRSSMAPRRPRSRSPSSGIRWEAALRRAQAP